MNNIHFTLRSQRGNHPTITLHVSDSRFKGRRFRYSIKKAIDPQLWLKKKERVKIIPGQETELVAINDHLDRVHRCVIDFLALKVNSKTIISEELKIKLDSLKVDEQKELAKRQQEELELEKQKLERENSFFTTWERIINTTKNKDGLPLSEGTKTSKRQTLNLIKEHCAINKIQLSFETLDKTYYYDLDNFMINKGYSPNNRGKHFKEIKAIFREAEDRDIKVNPSFHKKSFKVIRIASDSIYLNSTDIKKLLSIEDLTPAQERLRDIFVMACYTGQRHSDWSQIGHENIINENGVEILRILQKKGKKTIHIPVHPIVRSLLNKYRDAPPKVITNQKFNEALKIIGAKARLGKISISGKIVEKKDELTTHTARRSFATNAYLSKSMTVYEIMNCTGHKSESSFLKYLKLDGLDFAKQAAESEFFNDFALLNLKVA